MTELTYPPTASLEETKGPALSTPTAPVTRTDICWFGLLMMVVIGVMGINLWSRYNLYRLDILTFYLPWYEHLGERLRAFDIPGWMPYAMSGSPFAGDPQSGWGYLPAMVIFTIFLRQRGSPESKPVHAPHHDTGD